jgi:hypothetical protein
VLYHYPQQINTEKDYQIVFNRDFQTTELFLQNYKSHRYNSFIFGNSRSFFYQASTWSELTHGNCFHFNASLESLYGIDAKIRLLDELHQDIKNVIIILDTNILLKTGKNSGHLFIEHPVTSKESALKFQFEMFLGFFPKAMFAYTDLFFTGKKKAYMEGFGIKNNVWKHDVQTNQLSYYVYDSILKKDPDTYYKGKKSLFYKRDSLQVYSRPVISSKQLLMLNNIREIFKRHKTDCKIIINPNYDQKKISAKDLAYLKVLFGAENVFDFSGKNAITNNYRNYYETEHYRPFVCDSILQVIY